MNTVDQQPPAASQASSHFPLEPTSGATLFKQEACRRDHHTSQGNLFSMGCHELDLQVLCSGGFEKGCVVGISAEEAQDEGNMGLVMALQVLARRFMTAEEKPTAMVITTLSMGALLPLLRDVFEGQVATTRGGGGGGGSGSEVEEGKKGLFKGFLETVQVARVFDVPGLWEVLGDLDRLGDEDDETLRKNLLSSKGPEEGVPSSQTPEDGDAAAEDGRAQKMPSSSPLSEPPSSLPDELPWETTNADEALPRQTPPGHRDEIQDSEEEDDEGFSPLSPENASPHKIWLPVTANDQAKDVSQHATSPIEPLEAPATANSTKRPSETKTLSKRPDMIIITHMSTLLSNLFQQREKSTAHQTLQLLSSHIRYLTRASAHGEPLVMLLNSTTSSSSDNVHPIGAHAPDRQETSATPQNRPLDPTLRSIFNPPSLPVSGLKYAYDTPHTRRNKPSFGLVFTQMLDMHLLCTRIPKTRDDAEALYAPTDRGAERLVTYGWVVEVLLDEIGIWAGRAAVEAGRKRKFREQRWGAVAIKRDVKSIVITNLFESKDRSE